jgi:transcriptional regulator with XRE-family HTH domain
VVRRRDERARLARRLRALRQATGLSETKASRRADISQSKISKLEHGLLLPKAGDVEALCRVYGAAAKDQEELLSLVASLRSKATEPARVILARGAHRLQQRVGRLEASSSLLRSFQPCMVIGLLQTEAYAGAVFGTAVKGRELERAVAARLERQAALHDERKRLVLIMSEGALRWHAGSPAVMVEQLQAIAEATKLPTVRIGIVPYSIPMPVFPRHGWHMYDSDAVIVGTETGTATITDDEDIADYERLFATIEERAAFDDAAREVLERIADDYRRLSG